MKFIKFSMRNKKDDFVLPMAKAEQIMLSEKQTIMVANEEGRWTGIYVNKADIMKTDRDYEAERDWRLKNPVPAIEEEKGTPVTTEYMKKVSGQVKQILKKAKV